MQQRRRPRAYLAARYSRREELAGYAAQLHELGVALVVSRWLTEPHDWDGTSDTPEGLAAAQRLANDDLEDLGSAHLVVVFTEEAGEYRRGGSLVEFGMALGLGKHVIVVGPAVNVFTTLPFVFRCHTWGEALAHLVQWRDAVERTERERRLLS